MTTDISELSARLMALETVVGHMVTRHAIRTDDPQRWLSTRKRLALQAISNVQAGAPGTGQQSQLMEALRDAIAEFFDNAEQAVCSAEPQDQHAAEAHRRSIAGH
ncbi:hypothetical protein [Limobrevibacterium gyesilva]|uniref:Uncharacterized protein n=1 Tax=Limobrevibacterium gyesilva TaxID=2991712 RepID=A0AA41YVU0_9PROT|nr:hypothetical protein [Limobrevibacterium gyesilva]MCW3477428.1 hypothetical protein [Limobrevibacterium gyesilva]